MFQRNSYKFRMQAHAILTLEIRGTLLHRHAPILARFCGGNDLAVLGGRLGTLAAGFVPGFAMFLLINLALRNAHETL